MATSETPPPPLTVTVKAAAMMLGLSNVQVYALLDDGHLDGGYTPKGVRLVKRTSLIEFVDNLPTTRPGSAA